MVVEHLRKHAENSGLVLGDRTLDINIKQNGLGGDGHAFNRRRIHHRVIKFVSKILHSPLAANFFIGKKVGQHFQEVRFTASKEARNPNADLVGRIVNGLGVVIKKGLEVSAQLLGDYVLAEFLLQTALIILRNFDNAVNIAVYVLLEHILKFHLVTSITAD